MNDPLANHAFKSPGIMDMLKEIFLGDTRKLDCAQIEVTSICSSQCDYCPHTTQSENWKSRHMRAETFSRLWNLLKYSRRAHLQGWGEPLLHPRFFDFVKFALKAGCQVSTTSCGMHINEAMAERIAGSGMDLIAFSLAGTDHESNAIRKNIPFEKVCAGIATLRQSIERQKSGNVPEIHLAYLLLADRMEAAAGLPMLMEKLNVEMAVVSTLDYLSVLDHARLAFAPHEKDKIAKAGEILAKAAEEANNLGRIIHYALPGDTPVAHAGGCRENILSSLYVDADGNVSPCVYVNVPNNRNEKLRRTFGNVCERDALEIWKDAAFIKFRADLKASHPDMACLGCPKRFERVFM